MITLSMDLTTISRSSQDATAITQGMSNIV